MSVRDQIHRIEMAILAGDLPPVRARQLLASATALHGFCLDERLKANQAYRVVYAECFEKEGKANRAKIRAQATPEWEALETAELWATKANNLTLTLKAVVKSLSDELRAMPS